MNNNDNNNIKLGVINVKNNKGIHPIIGDADCLRDWSRKYPVLTHRRVDAVLFDGVHGVKTYCRVPDAAFSDPSQSINCCGGAKMMGYVDSWSELDNRYTGTHNTVITGMILVARLDTDKYVSDRCLHEMNMNMTTVDTFDFIYGLSSDADYPVSDSMYDWDRANLINGMTEIERSSLMAYA